MKRVFFVDGKRLSKHKSRTRGGEAAKVRSTPDPDSRRLHRLKAVCRLEGVSKQTLARQLNLDAAAVSRQIQPDSDMLLSDLYKWSRALEVPAAELLVESDQALAAGVSRRAQLVRIMKTAVSIHKTTTEPDVQSAVASLMEQLIDMMPQLADVTAWPELGQPRRLDEVGVAAERRLTLDAIRDFLALRKAG